MMQAYAEGFELMSESDYGLDLPRHRHALEPGQRGALVAARADGRRAGRRSEAGRAQAVGRRLRRRPLDGATTRWRRPCPRRPSPRRCSRASGRGARTPSPDRLLAALRNAVRGPCRPAMSRSRSIIFGASGDLTHRKLMPALLSLYAARTLPEPFAVVGTGAHRDDRRRVPRQDARGRHASSRG